MLLLLVKVMLHLVLRLGVSLGLVLGLGLVLVLVLMLVLVLKVRLSPVLVRNRTCRTLGWRLEAQLAEQLRSWPLRLEVTCCRCGRKLHRAQRDRRPAGRGVVAIVSLVESAQAEVERLQAQVKRLVKFI